LMPFYKLQSCSCL